MVWAEFLWAKKSQLVFVEGNMNGVKYLDILETHMILFIQQTFRDNFVHMDDNVCPHCARLVQGFLDVDQVEHMEWLAKSQISTL